MFHSNVAVLLGVSGGWEGGGRGDGGRGVREEKAPPFKERNISSEMESYSVIIQKCTNSNSQRWTA